MIDPRSRPDSALALYAREIPGFGHRVTAAIERLHAIATAHPGKAVQATSLGAEDMVITDLIAQQSIPLAVATLATGKLHPETETLVATIAEHYGIEVEKWHPVEASVIRFVETNGEHAMYRSVDLRKQCCALRKSEPLSRLLAGRSAWVTGLRREQSNHRVAVPYTETDQQGRLKANPIADWSWADVWHYIGLHEVPYNPLHDALYPSIGCAPCTRAIAIGDDFRAGRWWWEDDTIKECGLHVASARPGPGVAAEASR